MPKRRANGEGSIYQRKDGAWTAQYTDVTGKKRYLYGKSQKEVKEKLKEALRQYDAGVLLNPTKMSFPDWVEEWIEIYQKPLIRETTYSLKNEVLRRHIKPYFQNIQLKDIREEMLQKFLNEKLEKRLDGKPGGYSSGVYHKIFSIIYASLKKAVELGYLVKNPAEHIKVPPRTYKEKRIFTIDEQRRFEAQVKKESKNNHKLSIFLLMLYTGIRIGEALGLQVNDIDFENHELCIQRTVSTVQEKDGGVHFYVRVPKTRAGRRTIPLSPQLESILKAQIEGRSFFIEAWRERWEELRFDFNYIESGYLYITDRGNVPDASNIGNQLNRICQHADVPRITPHGLRHTFATRWIEAGLDIRSLAEILGHTDVKMTLNTYTHATQEQKKKNMDSIGALFENNL